MDTPYVSGSGILMSHFATLFNLELVKLGLRPSFMVQWIDYLYKNDFLFIINYIRRQGFKMVKIDQGIIVYIDDTVLKYVELYNKNIYRERNLGKLLGYPAAGDVESYNKKFVSIYVKHKGEYHQLMVNAYSSVASYERFLRFYKTVKDCFTDFEFVVDDGNLEIDYIKIKITDEDYENYRKFNKQCLSELIKFP